MKHTGLFAGVALLGGFLDLWTKTLVCGRILEGGEENRGEGESRRRGRKSA